MSKVVDMCIMKNYVLVSVGETGQTWSAEDDFVLEKPSLDVRVQEYPRIGRVFNIQVSFTNPLTIELTKCNFNIEAPGVIKAHEVIFRTIKP
jgi:transglutaminase 1